MSTMAAMKSLSVLALCLLLASARADKPAATPGKSSSSSSSSGGGSTPVASLSPSVTQQNKDLFPLDGDDLAIVNKYCNGKATNDNFHPCPIKGRCNNCGKPVIVKFPQGDLNDCNNVNNGKGSAQGNVNSNPNSQSTYLCGSSATDLNSCCALCGKYKDGGVTGNPKFKCKAFVFLAPKDANDNKGCGKNGTPPFIDQANANPAIVNPYLGGCGWCFLLNSEYCAPTCSAWGMNASNPEIRWAQYGRTCASGKDDPHFEGADGSQFDFNGTPERSFCLVADRGLQVNARMHGYYDTRTVGATVLKDGRALRTWMRELGFVWRAADGKQHTLRLVARSGKQQERGTGFLDRAEADGVAIARLAQGESVSFESGLTLTFSGEDKMGPFDVDVYRVSIAGRLELDVKLRVAHPLQQSASDAETHFNLAFEMLEHTPAVHGVIGQTFRSGRTAKSVSMKALSTLLAAGETNGPFAADGHGLLEGNADSYATSDVLAPDCRFSTF